MTQQAEGAQRVEESIARLGAALGVEALDQDIAGGLALAMQLLGLELPE